MTIKNEERHLLNNKYKPTEHLKFHRHSLSTDYFVHDLSPGFCVTGNSCYSELISKFSLLFLPTTISFIHNCLILPLLEKKYRAVRNFLQMIIKRNTLIGLKRLEYGITKILYAIYYIMRMYSDTSCFNFFPFPHLNTNQCLKPPSQPHESKTYSLRNIFNLLKTGYNFLSSKFLRF